MINHWKSSCYTTVITSEAGELLLHNSFMGSVARIPSNLGNDVRTYLREGVTETQMSNPVVKELCEEGFFVPSDLDEKNLIPALLAKEEDEGRLGLMILPHENCNFRCEYCYETFSRGKMPNDVIYGLQNFVDKNIAQYKGLGVAWFGGEPLLAIDVIAALSESFIQSCERNNLPYSAGMSTNGYLLTPRNVDILFKSRVRNFQICVDGPETIHNHNRHLVNGKGSYSKIISNLMYLRELDENFFVNIRVNFNNASIPLIHDWLVQEITPKFSGDQRFGLYFEPITKRGGPNDDTLDVCDTETNWSSRSKFFEDGLSLRFSDATVKKLLSPHGQVCYAARKTHMIVGSNGNIYKCSLKFNDPLNNVGTINRQGDLILDESKMRLWTTLEGRDSSACDSCSFFPSCQGKKCPLVTITQNKPACAMTKEMYENAVKCVAYGKGLCSCNDLVQGI